MDDIFQGINGTLIWYFYVCKREVWLMAHGIEAEQDNDYMVLGSHIHETFYKRNKKEILIDNVIKIDVLNNKKVIGEIKKTSKNLKSAKMQLGFYLYYMKHKGVELKGELLFPEERKKETVILTPELEKELDEVIAEIKKIIELEVPPKPQKIHSCRYCAYKAMCWS